MKKVKIIILIIAAVLLLAELGFLGFQAISKPEPTEPPVQTAPPTEAPTDPPTEAPTEPPTEAPTEAPMEAPTEAPTEPPVLYTNPLTGEPLEEPLQTRIFAVSNDNIAKALPHVGADQADLYFEMFINDHSTRGLALFADIRQVETFGAVRSWRYNFTDIALAYDTIGGHAGGSNQVLADANSSGIDHINVSNTNASFRDKDRKSTGYATEHTLMINGTKLYDYLEKKNYRVTQDPDKTYGMTFTADGTPADGEAAGRIVITFTHDKVSKLSTMTYDESLGEYVYTQYGKEIDSVKEKDRESFENVFVIITSVTNQGVYHVADLDAGGDGYYACGGKIIPIKWVHENPTDPITFTHADGTPLVQGIGDSYIGIATLKSTVEWE